MAGKTAVLSLKIIGDATSAQRAAATTKKELSDLEKAAGAMEQGLKVAGLAAGAGLMKGMADAIAADSLENQLAAQLDLSATDAAAAGALAGNLYRDAYGDSLEDVNNAIGAVGSTLTTVSANGGADLERLTKKALDLAGAFDVDVAEATTAAGAMMTSGLAADADQAMDTIVSAMQRVPAGVRDEILPSLTEYSKHYAALGLDASTVAGIMVNASAQGAIGVDKMGDALKELTIRSTDGSAASIAAYDAMGLNAEETAAKMLAGGETAQEGFGQIVAGLQNMEDPVAQAAAAVALFGTPLEDLGVDQIPNFLGQIDPMGDAFQDVAGAAEAMGEKLNTGPGVALEEFKRTALGSLQDVAAGALPVLQPVLAKLTEFAPIIGPVALGIAALAATVWIVNGAMTAWNAIMVAVRVAMALATAAQWLWNAAMSANPIGLIIALVAGLVAGIVWAYNNIGWFKDAVDAMWAAGKLVWDGLVQAVQNVIEWLDGVLAPIGGIDGALLALKTSAGIVFGSINTAIQGTIGWVKDAIGWFQGLFGAKNDANSVSVDTGAAAASAAPMMAMAMPMMATAGDPALDAGAPMAASYSTAGAPAALIAGIRAAGSTARPAPAPRKVEINFSGLVTDRVGVAREIRRILREEEQLVGTA